jgi:PAS domain S-box-containing protein
MPIFNHPYMALLIISAIISAILAITTLKFRPNLGTRSFAALNSAVALWAFVALFEVGSLDPLTKSFSYSLKYVFVVVVPVAWLSFGLYYSNRLRHLPLKSILLLLALPAVTLLMVITNDYHHLMFTTTQWIESENLLLLQRDFGPWFWIHAGYCYLLLLLGFVFLAKSLIDSPAPYRSQVITLMVGGLTPWVCNMIYVFKFYPLGQLDITPFAFTVSGLAFMWGLLRHRLLDITPVARDVVIQSMKDAAIVVDITNRIVDLNMAATRLLGKKEKDLIGLSATTNIAWWRALSQNSGQFQNNFRPSTFEHQINGQTCLFQATQSPIIISNRLMGYLVLVHDITDGKRVEEALRNSESRFRSLTENAAVIIFSLDTNGKIIYANPAFTKILGYSREEVIEKPFYEFVAEDHNEPHADRFRQLIEGQANVVELNLYFLHKNGTKRLFNATASVNTDLESRVTGIIGLAKDITEERALQHQLFQSQKMEAIGTLAGGIAHDFNNLLMGMQANISLMRLEPDITLQLTYKLNRIEDQIQSGASLTRQLLGYARKGKYVVTTINFHRLIEETLNVVQRTNKNIVTDLNLSSDMAHVEADRGQIELVLLNLFVNAVDAMPDGGKLKVTTQIVNGRNLTKEWPKIKPGSYIETRVIDTGIGMAQATMDRIFEPFFTTKEMGQGTGLGLASVYGVVQNHGGHIRVESQLGKGTTFFLLFPLSENTIENKCREEKGLDLPPGDHAVLLVDDEALVLKYCSDLVESLGFKALVAHNGPEAIGIYEKAHHTIELVILDMVMPDMDGLQTYRALKKINNDIAVILSTGYTLDERAEKVLADGCQYLRKPYTRNQLANSIASVMSASRLRQTVPPAELN